MIKRILILVLIVVLLFFIGLFLFDAGQKYDQTVDEMIEKYNPPKKDYVIVIDYRKHLFTKRLCLYDVKNRKEIFRSRVAHAYNSGLLYASDFSNENESRKSCYGAFLTGGSYNGQYGYAMRVNGLDKGINDQALSRAIVFHSVNKLPVMWSWGCFVTPPDINRNLIDLTKEGRLVVVLK
jgi:hypothetical protein